MNARTHLLASLVLLLVPATVRAQQPTHIVAPGEHLTKTAPPSVIEGRLQDVVHEYADRTIPRIGLYDAAFPRDREEFAALHGNALLLVVTVTTSRDDTPLRALTAVSGPVSIPLSPISVHTYQLPEGTYGTVLGRYRTDAFFVVPAALWAQSAQLIADFPTRPGFVMGTLQPPPDALTQPIPAPRPAPDSAVKAILAREFPGFELHPPTP